MKSPVPRRGDIAHYFHIPVTEGTTFEPWYCVQAYKKKNLVSGDFGTRGGVLVRNTPDSLFAILQLRMHEKPRVVVIPRLTFIQIQEAVPGLKECIHTLSVLFLGSEPKSFR